MPERKSEMVLKALMTALEAARPAGASLKRNVVLPKEIPGAGAMILRDGDPGQPEVTLSPLEYHYEHRAEIDVLIDRAPDDRDAAFDTLVRAVGQAVTADRTLGGLCDWAEGEAPAPLSLAIEGAEGLKAATLTLVLHYSTSDPLA